MQIIDSCVRGAREIEAEWIGLLMSHDARLLNVSLDGFGGSPQSVTQAFREKMSTITRGRLVSDGTKHKQSLAQKGRAKSWSADGAVKVSATQFVAGVSTYDAMPPEQKEAHAAASARQWVGIPAAERSRMASERNRAAWAKRSPAERTAIANKIKTTRMKDPDSYLRAVRNGVARREAKRAKNE